MYFGLNEIHRLFYDWLVATEYNAWVVVADGVLQSATFDMLNEDTCEDPVILFCDKSHAPDDLVHLSQHDELMFLRGLFNAVKLYVLSIHRLHVTMYLHWQRPVNKLFYYELTGLGYNATITWQGRVESCDFDKLLEHPFILRIIFSPYGTTKRDVRLSLKR
jgi:hypothetical protein